MDLNLKQEQKWTFKQTIFLFYVFYFKILFHLLYRRYLLINLKLKVILDFNSHLIHVCVVLIDIKCQQ